MHRPLRLKGLVLPRILSCSLQSLVRLFLPFVRASSGSDAFAGGSIKIASNNPLDKPTIDLGYLTDPFDILAFKEGVRIAKRWYAGPAYKDYITGFLGPDPDTLSEKEFDDQLKASAGTFWHPVGTASMSPRGAKHGVLDPDLKVKGIKGLRVVDASAIVSWQQSCVLCQVTEPIFCSPMFLRLIRRQRSTSLPKELLTSSRNPGMLERDTRMLCKMKGKKWSRM